MVRIVGAPGFEDFDATLVEGLERVDRGHGRIISVVMDESGEIFVVPSRRVVEGE